MRKARVLIVDDSTVIRRLLSDALAGDSAIEVVGTASNGRIALARIPQINPDVVTLDIEMPEMDGLETLKELRKLYPRLPVIMFSTLTERGAVATLNALAAGASDYVTKPANVGSVTAAMQNVREQLIPRIKGLCPAWAEPRPATRTAPTPCTRPIAAPKSNQLEIIAIGVSTGGPNALTEIFRQLPKDLSVPVVVVQHMPPVFTRYLAERLNAVSALHVREATAGELLHAGGAWLAPGGMHLALARAASGVVTRLHEGPPENSCRPAVDVLFRSVADIYGPAALGLILTGMGCDGLRGCQAIRGAGGRILIQDEATSIVWGMPGAVHGAGLADEILPLSRIPGGLCSAAARTRGVSTLQLQPQ
jgi:two-component system chemotaxis response regulator CheB